jgi:hypothetical protein
VLQDAPVQHFQHRIRDGNDGGGGPADSNPIPPSRREHRVHGRVHAELQCGRKMLGRDQHWTKFQNHCTRTPCVQRRTRCREYGQQAGLLGPVERQEAIWRKERQHQAQCRRALGRLVHAEPPHGHAHSAAQTGVQCLL